MDEQATISDELRADLMSVWLVGFMTCMKGDEVLDADTIPSDMAPHLVKLAEGSIDAAASLIAEVFAENPLTVYGAVYEIGYGICSTLNAAHGVYEVNLDSLVKTRFEEVPAI